MLIWVAKPCSWEMTMGREISSNAPALVVRVQGSDRSLEAGPSYSIGRNPESDIVITEARVSWRHAVLRIEGGRWAAGLSAGAYLWSKLLVLGVLSALQAVVMTLIGLSGRPVPAHGSLLPSSMVELLLAMAFLAMASMTVGLLISAVVKTSETTLVLLFISVILQIVLTGGVIAIAGKVGVEQLAWISPSRWGFGAVASTTNLNMLQPGQKPDALWTHSGHTWLMDMAMQVVLAVVFAWITWRLLKRAKPGHR
jgi:ABC transport system ATP-binding/permease protein